MTELARRHPSADGVARRALNQAARELLLMQSSDWPFIMRTGTTVPYATRRMNQHILRFNRLYDDLVAGRMSEPWLAELESRDNLFPDIDYRIYAS
jgi:1,4-alpha-glucan branching enzyme